MDQFFPGFTDLALQIEIKKAPLGLVLFAEVPGVEEGSLKVGVAPAGVELQGRRKLANGGWAQFRQLVSLPLAVDPDKTSVKVHEGLLRVAMPYAARRGSRSRIK